MRRQKITSWIAILLVLIGAVHAFTQDGPHMEERLWRYANTLDSLEPFGKADIGFYDQDDDGYPEWTAVDYNGDEVADVYMRDYDGNGAPELYYYDYNGDGYVDAAGWDYSGNGLPDAYDLNANGKEDAFDYNRDGWPDAWDDDEDGSIDRTDENDDHLPDTAPSNGSSLSTLLIGLFLGALIAGFFVWRKKSAAKSPKKEKSKGTDVASLFTFSSLSTSTDKKVLALILNLFIPGVGYFLFGQAYRKKAIIFIGITLVSYLLLGILPILVLLLLGIWAFCIIDLVHLITKR